MSKLKPVKTAALTLLARQAYTTRKLNEKLLQKGYTQQEVTEIIEWCTEAGYLNDAEWALRAAEHKAAKGWDSYKTAQYLRAYGVSREDREDAIRNTVFTKDGDYAND